MNLQRWAERQIGVVEQDGSGTVRIRLICTNDGSQLETWEGEKLKDAAEWVESVNTLIDEYREEWPVKPIQLLFLAEDKNGHLRSQCPKSVTGRNQDASVDLHKSRDVESVSRALEANVRTMDRILSSANAQLDRTTESYKVLAESHADTLKFLHSKLENEALTIREEQSMQSELLGMIKENAPGLLKMIEHAMRGAGKPKAANVAQVASAALNGGAGTGAASPPQTNTPQ